MINLILVIENIKEKNTQIIFYSILIVLAIFLLYFLRNRKIKDLGKEIESTNNSILILIDKCKEESLKENSKHYKKLTFKLYSKICYSKSLTQEFVYDNDNISVNSLINFIDKAKIIMENIRKHSKNKSIKIADNVYKTITKLIKDMNKALIDARDSQKLISIIDIEIE